MSMTIKYLTLTFIVSQFVLNNAWSTNQDIIEKPTTLAHRTLQTVEPMNFEDCFWINVDNAVVRNDPLATQVITSDHSIWQKIQYFINSGRNYNSDYIPGGAITVWEISDYSKKGLELINIPEIFIEESPLESMKEYSFQVFRDPSCPTIVLYGIVLSQPDGGICYTPEVKAYILDTPGVPHYDFDRTEKAMTQLNTIPSKTVPTVLKLFDVCLSDDLITSLNGITILRNMLPDIDIGDAISHGTTNPNLTFNEPTTSEEIEYLRPRGKRAAHRVKNFNSYIEFICCAQELPTEVINIIAEMLPKVILPKSQFTQEREEQEEAYAESLKKDQEKDRLAQEKGHIIQTYPAVIQAEEEKYESLKEQAMQKTRELQQMRYDLPKNPQKQQDIDALTAEIATLTDELSDLSRSLDERKAKLESAQKKQ